MSGWWAGKLRQAVRYFAAISPEERVHLGQWLSPEQLALFESMHRADQRHGLDVVRCLRDSGRDEADLLLAGLFHDAAKGRRVRLMHRVAWSLGERYGRWVWSFARRLPGWGDALDRLEDHAERSAALALKAGCSPLTADLIRDQAAPHDERLGEALRLADEAN
ncbi:MAG: hypothetical protein M3301_03910 [Chloroflexota bacterium]|nr:hypothetical protein [Chloroflexota bacterium]